MEGRPLRLPPPEAGERFWSKVEQRDSATCWPWRGQIRENQGPVFVFAKSMYSALRVMYQETYGDLTSVGQVRRSCQTYECVNPRHLYQQFPKSPKIEPLPVSTLFVADSPRDIFPEDVRRFWSKVAEGREQDSCWEWEGTRLPKGYGKFSLRGGYVGAHRVSYQLAYGDLRENSSVDLEIDHLCRNPPCVNPRHLRQVPSIENQNNRGPRTR